ncbi:leucine carboxyl methyltransferase 1 like protein [Babesia gibsoni]|uniref:Leucine carboxyl methyltransferase 1 n=1 Tax=Babesia gibsoni TaxID=33632 RepID=A0AAD8USG6_BABGI|nr:leucine carboxyl methyltransferase 1 like protein [Babesia gibsoni]
MEYTGDPYDECTSAHVLECKWSAVASGYIEDDYIKYFGSGTKRGPLLNMRMFTIERISAISVHFLRIKAIRWAVTAFADSFKDDALQFVNLGCGFDTLALWILQNYKTFTCFELDLPARLEKKAAIMRRAKSIMELISEEECKDAATIVPVDLTALDDIGEILKEFGYCPDKPTLFLSECCLVYLDVMKSNEIIRTASAICNRPSCFVYWEQELGTELVATSTYPTIESQMKRYENLGWEKVSIMDMNAMYNKMKLECLDGIEEMVIVCGHFVIGVCATEADTFTELFKKMDQKDKPKKVKGYTTEEVLQMIKNGTVSQMKPAPLSTEWL